jgi:poly-gamma-glutamate capsule biosynthesis protein CapA/YwtB (metallophosphatase superfamily)
MPEREAEDMARPVVGLLGDVMLGRGVADALRRGRPEEVWSPEVRAIAQTCDLVICNLECCISERGEPTARIRGKPFFFRAPPVAIESLRAVGVGGVGLANNHALDYEEPALADTLELLSEAGIAVAGAGRDLADARRGALVEAGDSTMGLFAVSDHPAEFAAGERRPGIAHADLSRELPGWALDELERLRSAADLVIAFPHWGPNMSPAPGGWQRRSAALLTGAGADLVAGHSAHVFHGVGWSESGPLLYDLGDALDDYALDAALRNDLGLMALWRPGAGEDEIELVGLFLDFCRTELAAGEDAEWIARRLDAACGELGTRAERLAEQRFRITPG